MKTKKIIENTFQVLKIFKINFKLWKVFVKGVLK